MLKIVYKHFVESWNMADTGTAEYPDLLGYITGGERYNISAAQVALTVRPRVVRAGRPFEALMLIQNVSNANIDVTVTLQIPAQDAQKKKGRFVAKVERLVVGLQPAEVGYISLPLSSLPDTAVGSDYKVSMDISVKTLDKAERVRSSNGGSTFTLEHIKPEIIEKINDLKTLSYSTKKAGFRGNVLETTFGLLSGKVGAIVDLTPGWTSLWTLRDHLDDRLLMQRYWETLKLKVLPNLNRSTAFQPLYETTLKRFSAAGFKIKPLEALLISKLMTLIIEYAAPSAESAHGHLAAGIYDISGLLKKERVMSSQPMNLPKWISALLRTIDKDERAARFPGLALASFAYDALLQDAANHAFHMIEIATGENLGSLEERNLYIDDMFKMLRKEASIDFSHVYLPLVLGGILIFDQLMLPDEKLSEIVDKLRLLSSEREAEITDDDEPTFAIFSKIVNQAMMKYGYKGS